jgi:Fe-Mn family superoxide dismutase
MNLPYEKNIFEPIISEETFNYHYGKHYQNYINKLNTLTEDTKYSSMKLEDIVKKSSGAIFNNAAQIANHEFYWNSLSKQSVSNDNNKEIFFSIVDKNEQSLRLEFIEKAMSLFGSGWCWLVKNKSNKIEFLNTYNAGTPATNDDFTALFVCDVWEHAYYVDYKNDRLKYLEHFWKIINWGFVNNNFK